jgi:protein-glutamine gamma-glutamyltransferase
VRAVQRHLRSEYDYEERPPTRAYPLAAFLFQDRIGYCQQFSGAMALMLRTLGIPARVAAGFTPGSYNRDTKEYRVRDYDAHSWVEVWFTGLGWVPFDPTPSIAPADSQSAADDASASGGSAGLAEQADPRRGGGPALSERAGEAGASPPPGGSSGDGAAWAIVGALGLLLLAAVGATGLRARLNARRDRDARRADRDLAELKRALARLGEPAPPRLTLRELEGRLTSRAGPAAARYVRMLRERRYSVSGGDRPGPAERRDLRRALANGRGPRARLRAFVAMPPAAFRRG